MITNLGAERLLASSPGFSPIQRPFNTRQPGATTPGKIANLFFQGQKKPQKADYPVIILGGGLAGMTAAYKAHQHGLKALVLESSERLGGNAKTGYTQFVNGKRLSFPVGASVLAVANDEQRQFFKELGVDVSNPQYKIHNDIAFFDGAWVSINPEENTPETLQKAPWAKEFTDGVQNFIQILRTILRPRDGKPQFPLHEAPDEIFKWDKLDLKTFLDAFPEKVRKFFAVNLRSDISNDMESISALAGIIDQGADQGERCLFPGGNYFVIQKMINKIKADTKASKTDSSVTFQTHSPVVKIEEGKNFATVHYKGKNGGIKTVTGSHILLGIPSHRVPDVMPSLPPKTAEFLKSIQ
ncbi:MAG: NAD(P)-binding protein, partial [Cyanobacteria bacterium]|nr:NAD(P)-binding protein [Cyanobacteriota bacterium]